MPKEPVINKNTLFLIGGAIALIYGSKLLKTLFEGLGISQTKEGQEYDQQISDPGSFWNGEMWQKLSSPVRLLYTAQCEYLYNEIYDSFGIFNDDETRIYAAFKATIKAQSQLSYFAWWLQKNKNMDLLRWLHGSNYGPVGDHLSVSEIAVITNYVQGLPKK